MRIQMLALAAAATVAAPSSIAAQAKRHRPVTRPAAAAQAQEDPTCVVIAGQITDQLKNLSLLSAEGTFETSAIRQSARESKKNGLMSAISINMSQMTARACKPFAHPVGEGVFLDAALVCVVADMTAQAKANAAAAWAAHDAGASHLPEGDAPRPDTPECNMATWRPNG